MKKLRFRGIRWIVQHYYTACKWTTRIQTLVYISIPHPCYFTFQGLFLWFGKLQSHDFSWLLFAVIFWPSLFCCYWFYSRAGTCGGILGVAAEIVFSFKRLHHWIICGPLLLHALFLPLPTSLYLTFDIRIFLGVFKHTCGKTLVKMVTGRYLCYKKGRKSPRGLDLCILQRFS